MTSDKCSWFLPNSVHTCPSSDYKACPLFKSNLALKQWQRGFDLFENFCQSFFFFFVFQSCLVIRIFVPTRRDMNSISTYFTTSFSKNKIKRLYFPLPCILESHQNNCRMWFYRNRGNNIIYHGWFLKVTKCEINFLILSIRVFCHN